jgi:AraC-like DNA-binding protein
MRFDPAPPHVETLEIGPGRVRLCDVCLLSPERGELAVHFDAAPSARLGVGDLLRLTIGEECRVQAAATSARVRVLRVDSRWLEQALGLGASPEGSAGASHAIERASSESARRAQRLFEQLAEPRDDAAAMRPLHAAVLRIELLALAFETPASGAVAPPSRRRSAARATLVHLVARLHEASLDGVSLEALSCNVGLSERQVSRLFRVEFGTTFRDHLATLRLERAKQLFSATDLPVIEVAGHTGWSSLAHFNAVFRRRVGVTPTGFRAGAGALQAPGVR